MQGAHAAKYFVDICLFYDCVIYLLTARYIEKKTSLEAPRLHTLLAAMSPILLRL